MIGKDRFLKVKNKQCKVFDELTNDVLDIDEIVNTLNYYENTCLRYEKNYPEIKDELYEVGLDENEQLKEENKKLQEELHEFKEYVFSDEKILCYSCVNCVSKGIYEVDCYVKGKVDVHGTCFQYWKNEVEK